MTGRPRVTRHERIIRGGIYAGGAHSTYGGLPDSARWLVTDGSETYRHYAGTPRRLLQIVENSVLRAGHLPYRQVSPGMSATYEDLTGVFMTTSDFTPREVGVDSAAFVDFKLPRGLRVLRLEKGIFLLPGPPYSTGRGRRQLIGIEDHADVDVTRGIPTHYLLMKHWYER